MNSCRYSGPNLSGQRREALASAGLNTKTTRKLANCHGTVITTHHLLDGSIVVETMAYQKRAASESGYYSELA